MKDNNIVKKKAIKVQRTIRLLVRLRLGFVLSAGN